MSCEQLWHWTIVMLFTSHRSFKITFNDALDFTYSKSTCLLKGESLSC